MGFFWLLTVVGGGGVEVGKKAPLPKNLSHISYNDETSHSYTLAKGDPKKYESRDTLLKVC